MKHTDVQHTKPSFIALTTFCCAILQHGSLHMALEVHSY